MQRWSIAVTDIKTRIQHKCTFVDTISNKDGKIITELPIRLLKISIVIFVVVRHLVFSISYPFMLSTPYGISYLLLLIVEPMVWMGFTGVFNSTMRGAVTAYILSILGQVGMLFFGFYVLVVWPYAPWYRYNSDRTTPILGLHTDWLSLLNILLNLLIIAGWIYILHVIRGKLKRKLLFNMLIAVTGIWLQMVPTGLFVGLCHMLR